MRGNYLINYIMTALIFFGTGTPYLAEAQGQYKPGEILVKFKQDVSKAEIEVLNRLHGVSVIEYIEEINIYRLRMPKGHAVTEMVDLYREDPNCEYAEPNYIGEGGDFFPNDTFFPQQWYLDNIGQTGGISDADIDAVEGWQITRGSSSIVVAVLDTGIDSDHPEFQGRILPGFDFVNTDNDPQADHPHGIWVSGILAGNGDNAFSIAGIDHNVKILPVKILDSDNHGSTSDLIEGLMFAANQGADVINISLINFRADSAALNDALQFARNAGSILIACAGNGGIGDADVSGPGASPLTISIGATDDTDARAGFSGTGSALDLVAPGDNIPTTTFDGNQDGFGNFTGCSAATPVVSGVTTLLLSIDPFLTHDEIRDLLIQTAEDMVGPPDEDTPGRDDFFGHGRVNMNEALTLLGDIGTEEVVSTYSTAFSTPEPAAGWDYLWNESGPISSTASYRALSANGARYDTGGTWGIPADTEMAYGHLYSVGGHPGNGTSEGADSDRFAIAAYTVSQPGEYRIGSSIVEHTGCQWGNGVTVKLMVNNREIQSTDIGFAEEVDVDAILGTLSPGDTIYFALGPNGHTGCDRTDFDFSVIRRDSL